MYRSLCQIYPRVLEYNEVWDPHTGTIRTIGLESENDELVNSDYTNELEIDIMSSDRSNKPDDYSEVVNTGIKSDDGMYY